MTQKYAKKYSKPIRDNLVKVIKDQYALDAEVLSYKVEIGKVLSANPDRWPLSAIYVLPPGGRYADGRPEPTEANRWRFRYPVLCRDRSVSEETNGEHLEDLVGLVVDAIERDPLMAGLSPGIDDAWIEDAEEPDVTGAAGTNVVKSEQVVIVNIEVTRDQA